MTVFTQDWRPTSSQIGAQNVTTAKYSTLDTGSPLSIECSKFCAHKSPSLGNQICIQQAAEALDVQTAQHHDVPGKTNQQQCSMRATVTRTASALVSMKVWLIPELAAQQCSAMGSLLQPQSQDPAIAESAAAASQTSPSFLACRPSAFSTKWQL